MGYVDTGLELQFRECYNKAIAAKNAGNLQLAKVKFLEAADILDRQVRLSPPNIREEKRVLSQRIRAVANAIAPVKPANRPVNNSQNANNYNQGTPAGFSVSPLVGGGTQEQAESDVPEDMSAFFTFYEEDDLELGFDDVIGLEDAKEAITQYVINPIKYRDSYHYNFANNKAILLYGPPGTGKTTFAKALAKEVKQPFALVNVAALVNAYIGETGKNIDKIFNYLRDYVEKNDKSIIIFFDELDEIAKKRGGDDKTSQAAVPALLRNMDGVKKNKGFLILANTNCPEDLDSGVLDRFRQKILVDLPDKDAREKMYRQKLSDVEPEYLDFIDFDFIAYESEGLSGRAINDICDDFKYELSALNAGLRKIDDYNAELVRIIRRRQ